MFCKNCGSPMQPGQAICLACGFKAGTGNRHCANCGHPVNTGAVICLNCGFKLNNGYNKVGMALLAFFLGGLGVHNFVMGENKKGVAKIISSFAFGIGVFFALYDFIKILSNTYVIEPDKFF